MRKTMRLLGILLSVIMVMSMVGCAGGMGERQTTNAQMKKLNDQELSSTLGALIGEITVQDSELVMSSRQMPVQDLYSELPDIDTYPLSVKGNGSLNLEIFVATERSGSGSDGWMNVVAEQFNKTRPSVDGQSGSISIRKIASGVSLDYLISGRHTPDAVVFSNELWESMATARGVQLTMIIPRTAGNTAGILMSPQQHKAFTSKYGDVTLKGIGDAVFANDVVMGTTTPTISSTGLNTFIGILDSFDSKDLLSQQSVDKFEQFQRLIPPTAYTTAQMSESAARGGIDCMTMEYQAYINKAELKSYVFTPVGVRHDGPLYAVGTLSEDQIQLLNMFAEFCLSDQSQKLARDHGFNALDEYKGTSYNINGAGLLSALDMWKEKKDGGRPVAAVFVVDTSGSMDGTPISECRNALVNASQYISTDNHIGIVSYSDDVYIDLPIGKWDMRQRGYFVGAVENLTADGGTATYDAVLVATQLLLDYKQKVPDAKLLMFVMSDGQQNVGFKLNRIKEVIYSAGIPIHTIGYNVSLNELQELSVVNEASYVNANENDVVYALKNLLNTQM